MKARHRMTGSDSGERLPGTIDEAVALILSRMNESTRDFLRQFDDETAVSAELYKGITAGMNVRAMLGLWGRNQALLDKLPWSARHPDDASIFLLLECWRRLRKDPTSQRDTRPG